MTCMWIGMLRAELKEHRHKIMAASFFGGIKGSIKGIFAGGKVLIFKEILYVIKVHSGCDFHTPCPHIKQIKPRQATLYVLHY